MNKPSDRLEKIVIAVISISFVIWSAAFIYRSSFIAIDGKRYFCLFDDAMISMRYAWNFSHGYGLVWNPFERIQGYSNLLMTLLMSFTTLIFNKSIAVLSMQILGIGFMLVIAYLTIRISDVIIQNQDHQRRTLSRILVFFCALSYYPQAYWSLMGMETGLLTLFLLSGVLFAFTYGKINNLKCLFYMAVCLGLAYLTRNDSLIFAFFIWLYIFWETVKSKTDRKGLTFLLLAIAAYLVFIIGQLVFQHAYYGELLPNTYTLKLTGMPLLERIRNGVGFIKPFLKVTSFVLVLTIVDLIFDFRKQKLLLLFIMFSAIGYEVYAGGDPWNYWRIISPSMPLVTILFISAVNAIVFAISNTQAFNIYFLRNPIFPRKYTVEALIILLTLIGLTSANRCFLKEILFLKKPYRVEYNQNNVNTAIALSQLTTGDATVGVYSAGSIPYYSGRRAIDFLGKSDRYIAHLSPDVSGIIKGDGMYSVPGHNKYDLNYSIKTLKPTYVQDFSWGSQDLSKWAETRYIKIEYYGISIFLLKDSPQVLWSKINVR